MILPRCVSGMRSPRILFSLLSTKVRLDSKSGDQSYLSRIPLLCSSLTSPWGAGAPSDCPSSLTRGINDSIVRRHSIVFYSEHKRPKSKGTPGKDRTSQFSRTKHRAAAADLRGGNASAASLTPRSVNFAAEDVMDLRFGFFLVVALGSAVSSEVFVRFLFSFLSTDLDWVGTRAASRSRIAEESGQEQPPEEVRLHTSGCLISRGKEAGRWQS